MLRAGQAALHAQDAILDLDPASALRDSLTVLADPAADWSDEDWETVSDNPSNFSDLEEDEQRDYIAGFVTRFGGEEELELVQQVQMQQQRMDQVRAARAELPSPDVSPLLAKMRAVQPRAVNAAPVPAHVPPSVRPRPIEPRVPHVTPAAPRFGTEHIGSVRALTAAEAALALTNRQLGTDVVMEEVRAMGVFDDDVERFAWVVGGVGARELTVAEAALLRTNRQAGTAVVMGDLRSGGAMGGEGGEEGFLWGVGNVE